MEMALAYSVMITYQNLRKRSIKTFIQSENAAAAMFGDNPAGRSYMIPDLRPQSGTSGSPAPTTANA
jgi:hypothetical protein